MFYSDINCGMVLSLLFLFFGYMDTQCSKANVFGPNCEFVCHCIKNEQCNRTTGSCSLGCDFKWAGPACQHKNIVPVGSGDNDMVPRQNSSRDSGTHAILAIDHDLSTCSYTNDTNRSISIPWWRVWLNSKHKIRRISIRTGTQYLVYFKQFHVTVENNTGKYAGGAYDDKELCYQHNDSIPQSTFIEVKCNKVIYGNQIRILLATKETQLVLCDLRIYGNCDDGTYGESCTEKCSPHCESICDKDNGTCTECENGWTGSVCTQMLCEDGRYGEDCTLYCSGNCKNNAACRISDGICVHGCSPGYKGEKCDQQCDTGWYGSNCMYQCSSDCEDLSLCRKTDGICLPESDGNIIEAVVGVGSALIVVVILGFVVIMCYLRRTRNGIHVSRNLFRMQTVGSSVDEKERESVEQINETYETIMETNVNEHEYENPSC